MAATSISTSPDQSPSRQAQQSNDPSSLSFLHIVIYISLTYLYFHSIFLSDGANYIIVPVPLRNHTMTTNVDVGVNVNADGSSNTATRKKYFFSRREYLKLPRSLPHLKAVNSLVEYQQQLDKYEKKNKHSDTKNNEIEGESEGEGNTETKSKTESHEDGDENNNEGSSSKNNKNKDGTKKTIYRDTLTIWSSIIVPLLILMSFSLSCRCLLAILIYRRNLRMMQENEFDIAGQRRQHHRGGVPPTHAAAAADFWQIFRTIPLRSRANTGQGLSFDRNGVRVLPTTTSSSANNASPSLGMGQQLRMQMLESMTRRLNQERIANGAQPLSPSSLAFLLSRNNEGFSGEDYNRLWSMEEANGTGHNNANSEGRGRGLDEEDIARFPVRLLEVDDDLLLPIINHDYHQVSDDADEDDDDDDNNKIDHSRNKCSICLEEFKAGEMVRTIPCFHEFHTQCIDQWLQIKDTCPICKHATRSED